MMTTNMKEYIVEENEEIREVIKDTTVGKIEHDLYDKYLSNQFESDETDTLEQKTDWWKTVVDRGVPITNDFYDCSFGELFRLHRKAIYPEMQDLVKSLGDRQQNQV